jgi:hypothetical protein
MQMRNGLLYACLLLMGCVHATGAMCGNQELMDAARKKAFMVNEQVVKQMGNLVEPAQIYLKGRVKQLPDGTLQIVIDQVDTKPLVESGEYPFNEGTVSNPIDYVIFKEIPPVDH